MHHQVPTARAAGVGRHDLRADAEADEAVGEHLLAGGAREGVVAPQLAGGVSAQQRAPPGALGHPPAPEPQGVPGHLGQPVSMYVLSLLLFIITIDNNK